MAERVGQNYRLWKWGVLVPQGVSVWYRQVSFRSECSLLPFSVMHQQNTASSAGRWKRPSGVLLTTLWGDEYKWNSVCSLDLDYCAKDFHEGNTHNDVSCDLGLWDACQLQSLLLSTTRPLTLLAGMPAIFHPIPGPVWVSDFTSVFDVLWASSKLMLWEGNFYSSQLVSELWLGAKWPQFHKLWVGPHHYSWFSTNNH